MMKQYIIYKENGCIVRTGTCPDFDYEHQAMDGELIMEGAAERNQYIENGTVVDMPPKPDGEYQFDYTSKSWLFNTVLATQIIFAKRDQLLRDGPDRISPVWWASMTTEQQQAWVQYRQDLLNVPQQPGFPMNVVFPEIPS